MICSSLNLFCMRFFSFSFRESTLHFGILSRGYVNGAVESTNCTCPYEYGGWCKHIVAILMFAIEAPEEIEVQMPLDELLAATTAKELLKVLCRMAEDEPGFEEDLRAYLSGAPREHRRRDEWDD